MTKEKKIEISPSERIIIIQKSINGLKKDTANPFFKSKYMNLGSIVNALKPILYDNDCYSTHKIGIGDNSYPFLSTEICYKDGTVLLGCKSPLPVKDANDPQKLGSAITYMRRYNLTALLEIEEDDDDGQKANQEPKPKGDFDDWGKSKEGIIWCDKAFQTIKSEIKSCELEDSLKIVWKENSVDIARLKKYDAALYAEIIILKDRQKEKISND